MSRIESFEVEAIMQAKKKKVIIAITAILVLIAALVGFRMYLHVNSNQKELLREYALSDGPWAEQSIWESADGQAYLLSKKTSDDKIADVTAYFYFDEAWYPFQMNMTYGNTLLFADETDAEKFTGDFDIEDCVFTVKNLKATNENGNIPQCETYVFSEVVNYDELISQLPFDA